MRIGEKQILAWLDGELDDVGAGEVEQAVQADAALMARAEAHFLAMMQVKAAFAPLLDLPFPNGADDAGPAIARGADHAPPEPADAAEMPADNVSPDPSPPLLARVSALAQPALRSWGLVAAALILGLIVGRYILGSTAHVVPGLIADMAPAQGSIARDQDGRLVAAGALADALENGVEVGDSAAVRVPLSFRDKSGRLCRSFDTARLAGIACRDDAGWRLRLVLETSSGTRSAASESPFVGQAVDAMIAGNPLDAGEERAAARARLALIGRRRAARADQDDTGDDERDAREMIAVELFAEQQRRQQRPENRHKIGHAGGPGRPDQRDRAL